MKMNWRTMAALAVFASATAAAGNASAADIKEIRFGVEASYAPFESKTPAGDLQGFDA
jgi:lysine/arginine/ornithine transport system substrate-binding protein